MDLSSEHPLEAFLCQNHGVKYLRLQWADLSGILRTRIVPKSYCLCLVGQNKYLSVAIVGMLFPVAELQTPIIPEIGALDLRPDWSSLRICHFAPGHASVMCNTQAFQSSEMVAIDICPRTKLSKLLEQTQNLGILIGFEIEFVVLDTNLGHPDSIDPMAAWSTLSGLRTSPLKALEEVMDVLEKENIIVENAHTEGAFQLEISTGPMPPMEAIDALMYTYEAVKTIFSQHGLRATISPSASARGLTTGAHTHISIDSPDKESYFLAGIMEHIQSIAAIGMASFDSFLRVGDFFNGTGTMASWGIQHRDVPVRQIKHGHWELRCIDATANFYLFVYAAIRAGLDGIARSTPLRMKPLTHYVTNIGKEKLAELGVTEFLPRNMDEAISILKKTSTVLLMSEELKQFYLTIKDIDLKAFGKMSKHDRRKLLAETY